jgi:Protein of unknown function (DUF1566)
VRAHRRLRATLAASAIAGLATLARADAPSDQYNLFNGGSDVIKDQRTALSWQRVASPTPVDQDAAFAACAALSLSLTTGWRVPSYKELLTLVDEAPHTEYENGQLVAKAIDPDAFPGTAIDHAYWTSSPYAGVPNNAYTVSFDTGLPAAEDTLHSNYVRCVHD